MGVKDERSHGKEGGRMARRKKKEQVEEDRAFKDGEKWEMI